MFIVGNPGIHYCRLLRDISSRKPRFTKSSNIIVNKLTKAGVGKVWKKAK